ncbi:MAG: acetyltransferase [Rhodanobacteraceae bacterium]|nr:acetyltransferase [Rhodanobacteraceae bacterium]MBK7044649.1 acetyltransferase [Rhodanobacteraceae bacterium]MBP9153336.1 acetyltransferase [Xanthomonadales bacterium]HQW81042.1 acetyltransferase [Pseudomonadota bacterium]
MSSHPFLHEHPPFQRLYVFGAGGHGREIAHLARQAWGSLVEVVFLVDDSAYANGPVNGIQVRLLNEIVVVDGDRFVAAVGDSTLRRKAARACTSINLQPTVLVHPRVEASSSVLFGPGCVVCAGAVLTVDIALGEHVHVNIGCSVSHDVRIDDFSTLSPGVHVSGHVKIGRDVFIGTGANIINGSAASPLVIGDGALIAAGACVTKSVEAGALVAGVPAVRKK